MQQSLASSQLQQLQVTQQQINAETSVYTIPPECELRFEVATPKSKLTLMLLEGTAEIFGIEMAKNREYVFREEFFAVFSWHGCRISSKQDGKMDSITIYPPNPNPTPNMNAFINAHIQLEARRDVALNNQDFGPRVLVLGDDQVGKSTLCRILTSYAARLDRAPIYVDLDVNQSLLSLPGSIAAAQVDKTNLSIEEGIMKDACPIVFYPGIESPISNVDYYKHLIGVLAARVKERMAKDLDSKSSGLIINTNSWVEEKSYDVIQHIIKSFDVDIVLIINNSKLTNKFNDLQRGGLIPKEVTIEALPVFNYWTSTNVNNKKKEYRQNRVDRYFYGKSYNQVQGAMLIRSKPLSFKSFQIYCAKEAMSEGISSAGVSGDLRELLVLAPTSSILQGHILAILHPSADSSSSNSNSSSSGGGADSSAVATASSANNLTKYNIAGFLIVAELHPETDCMTVFSPCTISNPRFDLPSTILFRGSVKHVFR